MLEIFCEELNRSIVPVTLTEEESSQKNFTKTGQDFSSPTEAGLARNDGAGEKDRVIIDDYFIKNWEGEMITRDVDIYAREKYSEDIVHVFGTDTIFSMPEWDKEGYAAKRICKLFVPRWSDDKFKIQNSKFLEQQILESWILNLEVFLDSHIPAVSSTEIRKIIPEHTTLKTLFDENPKFIIPGLSRKISQYILEKRLYRSPPEKGELEGVTQKGIHKNITHPNPPLSGRGLKPRVLVHVCCGPDVTMPILQLRDEYDVICFWYDPNIQPKSEYDKRYEAFVRVCEIENIPYIKWAYDVGNFFTRIKWVEHTPERWEKCTYCYDMRMMVSAKLAKRLKIPLYTSSLNTSPKKDLEKLFKMGHLYAEKYGVEFLDIPFRKRWGFEKSVEYTREHDIYRQNYCGCIYSLREGGESEMKKRMVG
jgi:predicted adenine nucleotide alpha hydrolase (AANH) superfamily ATPase/nicotinic acid mononucleotide adenylyltransferase